MEGTKIYLSLCDFSCRHIVVPIAKQSDDALLERAITVGLKDSEEEVYDRFFHLFIYHSRGERTKDLKPQADGFMCGCRKQCFCDAAATTNHRPYIHY